MLFATELQLSDAVMPSLSGFKDYKPPALTARKNMLPPPKNKGKKFSRKELQNLRLYPEGLGPGNQTN
jgi:hypothetical protein